MRRAPWARAPAIALVLLAGFIPLYCVLADDWPVVYVVMLFWFDALLMILFVAIRILVAPPAAYGSRAAVPIIVFAAATLAFYGGLALAYGYLLAMIFGGEVTSQGIVSSPDVALEVMETMLVDPGVAWSALAILGVHLHALLAYLAGRGSWSAAEPARLFDIPLRQLAVLHVGIVLGGGVLILLAPPVVAAAVLLAGKTVADLRALPLETAAREKAASPARFQGRGRR
jgi:hypothetical protein